MIGFVYRQYKESTGPFFQGNEGMSSACIDGREAVKWWNDNKDYMQEIEIIIPPNKKIKLTIPIISEGEEDNSFEEEILSNIRIDPNTRIICNVLLKNYFFTSSGCFVKRKSVYHDKMHTKNMEILQIMKDVILGYIRYEPIKLEYSVKKGGKKNDIEYDWEICQDFNDVEYRVGDKKYKTNLYGIYTHKMRKLMMAGSPYECYGGHELQYFQRYYDLNYGAINYLCASRNSGKSFYSEWRQSMTMFKSPTFKSEVADDKYFDTYFFTPVESLIPTYSLTLKKFFSKLLIDGYGLSKGVADQIVKWKASEFKMTLVTANGDRNFMFYSEKATSPRGARSGIVNFDESNYLKNYSELSEFATKSGAQTIHNISTISKDSKSTMFYRAWVDAMLKTRDLKPIDEVIHYIWVKYGFNKMKSREDYKRMTEDGTYDAAKTEFYKLRPIFGMKATLDDIEIMTQEEKDNAIEKEMNSINGFEGMLAEYYCELPSDESVIKYRSNIIPETDLPRSFEKIYGGYDEADSFDGAVLTIGGISAGRLYVLESVLLPMQIDERYALMNDKLSYWAKRSSSTPSVIADIMRGPIIFREASKEVKYVDAAIKAWSGTVDDLKNTGGVYHWLVGTEALVKNIMNNELLATDRCFLSDSLSGIGGLFSELDTYVKEGKSYKGRGKAKDDQVTSMLYMCYYAWRGHLKEGGAKIPKNEDKMQKLEEKFQAGINRYNRPRKRPTMSLWNMW